MKLDVDDPCSDAKKAESITVFVNVYVDTLNSSLTGLVTTPVVVNVVYAVKVALTDASSGSLDVLAVAVNAGEDDDAEEVSLAARLMLLELY